MICPRSRGQAATRGRGWKPALPDPAAVFLTGTQIPADVPVGPRWGPGCAGGLSTLRAHLAGLRRPFCEGCGVPRTGSAAGRRARTLLAVHELEAL